MMKIGQPEISPSVTQPLQPTTAKPGQGTAPAAKSERKPPGVGVTVSASARSLEAARGGDTADVDLEKVNAVRQAIENNTFAVNPEVIADKLLSNAREMLQRSSS